MKNYAIMGLALMVFGLAMPAFAMASEPMTLERAIRLAVENSPDIKGAAADYGAAVGERRQAGVLPNPSLIIETENIAGNGPYKGFKSAETAFGVSQQILVGGKRSARINAAESGRISAQYGQKTAQMDVVRNVTVLFATAVAAQEQSSIMQEQVMLARRVYENVNKRVKAAAAPVVQRNKAKISLANAELMAEQAKGRQEASLKALSALLNNTVTPQRLSSQYFYQISKPEKPGNIQDILTKTADYQVQTLAIQQSDSLLDLERANAIPDPVISVSLRDFRETDNQAVILGLSVPIPVFDRNSGNIQKARQLAVKSQTDRQKRLLENQANFVDRMQIATNAWLTATRIKKDILPEAQEAFRQAQKGYNAGKFAYLEVLDAQRTLTDVRIAYINALQEYHVNNAEIERLTASVDTNAQKGKR